MFIKADNNINNDKCPFILIDSSGSTCSIFEAGAGKNGENITVLKKEIEITRNLMEEYKIPECYCYFWNNSYENCGKVRKNYFDNKPEDISSAGGTNISPVLNEVKKNIFDDKMNNKDIYIITDGEVSDSNAIQKIVNDLYAEKINIYIFSVEDNNNDYLNGNCNAGTSLTKALNKNQQTNLLKKIVNYNQYHKQGFISLYNFDVPEGFLPFRDSIFSVNDMSNFIEFLKNEIKQFNNDENKLLKLAHELTRTLFTYTKEKDMKFRNFIVSNFSKYFDSTPIYSKIRGLLLNEIDNHVNHRSTSYQEYRNNRSDFVEKSQLNMIQNTLGSMTYRESDYYISFPIKTNKGQILFKSHIDNVNENISIWKTEFKKSGILINDSTLPVFPINIVPNPNNDQCLRQWVRTNYSHMYGKNVVCGSILSLFLIDMLLVNLSNNVSDDTKNAYVRLAKIMLEDQTGCDETILKKLYTGVELSSFYAFGNYLYKNKIDLNPISLWLSILDCINDQRLIEAQKKTYKDHNPNYYAETKEKMPKFNEMNCQQKYIIPNHTVVNDIVCYNNYISEQHYLECQGEYKCDICEMMIKKEEIIVNPDYVELNEIQILDEMYKKDNLVNAVLENLDNTDLLTIDNLDFDVKSFKLKNVLIQDLLNISKIVVKTKESFNKVVHGKYPFLKNLDMTNVCLAGGFCRSILLNQKMKDFDFFIYGLNSDQEYEQRLSKLINDLTSSIRENEKEEERDKHKFLYLYKPLYNVFEIIYVYDPTNHFKDNFLVDNFIDYGYKTLKTFDRKNVVPRDEYYFEDGDDKGIRMIHRFQFVMAKYTSVKNILEKFDISPSRVAYDGNEVYFNQSGYLSYKYMVNIVNRNDGRYTDMYDTRVSKYLSYGFDILFREQDIPNMNDFKEKFKLNNNPNKLQLCNLKFDINGLNDNKVVLKHNSHKKELLELLVNLEKEQNEQGKTGLYRSSFFCSLVSILRYVCINQIKYKFMSGMLNTNENGEFVFTNGTHKLSFVDEVKVEKFPESKWFTNHKWQKEYKRSNVKRSDVNKHAHDEALEKSAENRSNRRNRRYR